MQEKLLLINSMQKLINHIVVSKKNQEEIFASLSKNDFKKIISNLDDQNIRLRKISLALISQLLHANPPLKEKFCQLINIPLCPGRVALNSKLSATYNRIKNKTAVDMTKNIRQVFMLLKQPIHEPQKNCLFWFINYQSSHQQPIKLQYFTLPPGQNINVVDLMDPINSMIGFYLPERTILKKTQPSYYAANSNSIEPKRKAQYESIGNNRMINNYLRPANKPEQIKPTINPTLNNSLHITSTMPGYSTDRQMHYVPKQTVYQNNAKVTNFSMYQQPQTNYYQKNTTQIQSNPTRPNTSELQNQNRSKYTGIKLYTNPASTKNRQTGKYFEDSHLYNGTTTSTNLTGKIAEFTGGNVGVMGAPIVNKSYNFNQKQRGYETLRQKNIIQKYPY